MQALGKHVKRELEVTNRLENQMTGLEKNKTQMLASVDTMQKRYAMLCRIEELASKQVGILEQANKSDAHQLSQLDSKVRILRNTCSKHHQEAQQAIESAFNAQKEASFRQKSIRKKQKEVSKVLGWTEWSKQELKRIGKKIQQGNEGVQKEKEKEALLHEQQMKLDGLALANESELKKVDREMKGCAREGNELNVALLDMVDRIEKESAHGQHLTRQLRKYHCDKTSSKKISTHGRNQYQDLADNKGNSEAIPCEQLLFELDGTLCECIQATLVAKQDFENNLKRTQDDILKVKQESLALDQRYGE